MSAKLVGDPDANRFIRKLECFAPLGEEQKAVLIRAMGLPSREPKGIELVKEGTKTSCVHIILDGFACCYNLTRSGKRQIFSYLVPGDSCDLHATLLNKSDFGVQTLSDCKVARIGHASIHDITEKHKDVARAFWWSSLVVSAILQAWLTGIGRRSADKRIAHLFCELHCRLRAVGLTSDGEFELPTTQQDLADTVGMSPVHVNRSLMRLRREGWLTYSRHSVKISDVHRLARYADFDDGYLHLGERAIPMPHWHQTKNRAMALPAIPRTGARGMR